MGGKEQPSLEERAQQIDKRLICPVCPGETIDQSRAELAKQMRVIVREKLAAGESREQVLQFFVDRYGPGVLAAPPQEGFNMLIWVVPPVVVLGGLAVVIGVVRAMGRRRPAQATAQGELATPPELEPYLTEVDRDIEELLQAHKRHTTSAKPSVPPVPPPAGSGDAGGRS